jgi:hypothetical protein
MSTVHAVPPAAAGSSRVRRRQCSGILDLEMLAIISA